MRKRVRREKQNKTEVRKRDRGEEKFKNPRLWEG